MRFGTATGGADFSRRVGAKGCDRDRRPAVGDESHGDASCRASWAAFLSTVGGRRRQFVAAATAATALAIGTDASAGPGQLAIEGYGESHDDQDRQRETHYG